MAQKHTHKHKQTQKYVHTWKNKIFHSVDKTNKLLKKQIKTKSFYTCTEWQLAHFFYTCRLVHDNIFVIGTVNIR